MSYNLASIRNRILVDKLDDEDFDVNVLTNFINDAQRDIFSEYDLPFTEKIFTGDLPAGAHMFQFPDDVSQIQAVMIVDGSGRSVDVKDKFLTFREFNQHWANPAVNQAGSVYHWTLYGGKMIVSRPIDTNYNMTIYYNKVPKVLADDLDVPELPVEFEEALVLGAFYRVQMREGDTDEALLTRAEYQRKMEQMVARYGFRMSAGPIKMRNRQIGR